MRKVHTAVLGLAAGAAVAFAATTADANGRRSIKDDAAAAPFSWTGFYVGAHLGAMNTESSTITGGVCPGVCVNPDGDGFVGGVQAGFNYQIQQIVVGVEVDYTWSDASGTASCANPAFSCNLGVDNQGSVRGRLGLAMGRALPYITAGWAWADVSGSTKLGATTFGDSTDRSGWIWGAGVDLALTNNIILGIEYLRADFGTETHQYDVNYPVPMETETIRVRLNYKFN